MSELREDFELEMGLYINKRFMNFNEEYNKYLAIDSCFSSEVAFVNGAWFMFQELNK